MVSVLKCSMQIIDGKSIADKILSELSGQVAKLSTPPVLAYVLCTNDPAAHTYTELKAKAASKIGVETRKLELPETVTKAEVIQKLGELSSDESVDGILLQLPLFEHLQSDTWEIIQAIAPHKDVDGLTAMNQGRLGQNLPAMMPATVAAVLECLQSCYPDKELRNWVSGKHAVVVNHSSLVGRPLAESLLNLNATVTVAHKFTSNLTELLHSADIVITATGQTQILSAEMFKQDAIVIDVTSIRRGDKTVGDIIMSPELEPKLSALTPVPGGVGPLTIACLLRNLLSAKKD